VKRYNLTSQCPLLGVENESDKSAGDDVDGDVDDDDPKDDGLFRLTIPDGTSIVVDENKSPAEGSGCDDKTEGNIRRSGRFWR